MKKKIIVASTNPVKIECAEVGLRKLELDWEFEISGVSVKSGVSDQPKDNSETLLGAKNRASAASETYPEANYCVGIEAGLEKEKEDMITFAWVVITDGKIFGKARSASFYLPPGIVKLIEQGYELGEADDKFFGRTNSKQINGSVGLLTRDAITRVDLYAPAVTLAFIRFYQPELFDKVE